jgi:multidrug transporter EmrE-like cation transporter
MQAWLYLSLAIGLEVCGTLSMRASLGFTVPRWAAAMVIFYLLSFGCMAVAIKAIPVSTAYAIWSAAGTAIIAAVGIMHFGESHSPLKIICLVLIIFGVVGLKMAESAETP